MPSIEEKVEDYCKKLLCDNGVRYYAKNEKINDSIANALMSEPSKAGGRGGNFPDIQVLLEDNHARRIPVMIEVKGSKGKLEKLSKDGRIELVRTDLKNPYSTICSFAVNGALHYGLAVLNRTDYNEVIIVGVNGTRIDDNGEVIAPECKAYYVSKRNDDVPKEIDGFVFAWMRDSNIDTLYGKLDSLSLTEEDVECIRLSTESSLESAVKAIHQRIYDAPDIRNVLSTNEKLYFLCGLIMAGLPVNGVSNLSVSDFRGNVSDVKNDGQMVIEQVDAFLRSMMVQDDKRGIILDCLRPVFMKRNLWYPVNGESLIKSVFKQVEKSIIPLLTGAVRVDFMGRILNSLNDWVAIDNDKLNDVVLTPSAVTSLMVRLCRVNKDSFVWDTAMGSGGFLIAAMNEMVADARKSCTTEDELNLKIDEIESNQLLGIEILNNIFILSVINMILVGCRVSNMICADSHKALMHNEYGDFNADVFLLNPPYSAEGKGLVFVDEALRRMKRGYGAVLIQESAGSGQDDGYAKRILEKNTLIASIHMPTDLFIGKASVQTAIYLFKVARPHEKDDLVTFIDMSNDGYTRQNKRKSTQKVNLHNADHAVERYDEVVARVLGKKPLTSYYTEENGKLIKDTIGLNGGDWALMSHKRAEKRPVGAEFKRTAAEYLSFICSNVLRSADTVIDFRDDDAVLYADFKCGDLFKLVNPRGKLTSKELVDGDDVPVPYVAAKKTNNGVAKFCSRTNIKDDDLMAGNCIVFIQQGDGSAGYTTYQPNPFYATSCVCCGYNDNLDELTGLYLVTLLDKNKELYSHSRSWNAQRIKDTVVSLPVTASSGIGNSATVNGIDWDYMRARMREIELKCINQLETYLSRRSFSK